MPIYQWEALTADLVTPKHSTAFGSTVTGKQIEVARLSYKAGEGAQPHSHEHEQIVVMLEGRALMTIGDEEFEISPGQVALVPSWEPHSTKILEDSRVLSFKSVVNGIGHRI